MLTRSGTARAALASVAIGAAFSFCAAVVLISAACGIRVSAQDFPALKLSGSEKADTGNR